jgi:uncharacterized damage-inducible protein DinB
MMAYGRTQFETLFAYHWHTTRRMLDAAAQLGEAETREDPVEGRG